MVGLNIYLLVIGVTIKFASIAPEGSYWYDMVHRIKESLTQNSDTKIIIYSGTSMGDELDIVRKMRIGQLHAAGLTSHGLESISPEIRAYDIPLVFNSYEEFFAVRDKLFPELKRRYEQKGFVLLSHFAIGFIHIFSTKENLWGSSLWVWVGDMLGKAEAIELSGLFKIVPLQIADVLQALATGMVDSVFNSFYALHALQWSNHIKSYIPKPLYIYSAGVVIKKSVWDELPKEEREKAEKIIWENALETEKYVIKLDEETKRKLSQRVKEAYYDKEKMSQLMDAMMRIRNRVLEMSPEVKEFYKLIENELVKIRKQK